MNNIFCSRDENERLSFYKDNKVNFIAINIEAHKKTYGLIIHSFLEIKEVISEIEADFKDNSYISGLTHLDGIYVKIIDFLKLIEERDTTPILNFIQKNAA